MMSFSKRAFLSGLTMLCAATWAAQAGDPVTLNVPTDSWSFWGTAKTDNIPDVTVDGGMIRRIAISPAPAQPWDIGSYVNIAKPVHQGDVVLLSFWARAPKPPEGNDFVLLSGRIHENAPPGTSVTPETTFSVGRQWKQFYAGGIATKDYPAGTLSVGMLLGTGDQVIDFATVTILDYGPDYDLSKLPHN
jgi:hypothetical protein